MKKVNFKDQNGVMGKPGNMTDEECGALPVKHTYNDKFPAIESVWELTEEDLKVINKSKRIRLGIIGRGMSPVYLMVEPEEVTADNRVILETRDVDNITFDAGTDYPVFINFNMEEVVGYCKIIEENNILYGVIELEEGKLVEGYPSIGGVKYLNKFKVLKVSINSEARDAKVPPIVLANIKE